jgi:hypothetical protein
MTWLDVGLDTAGSLKRERIESNQESMCLRLEFDAAGGFRKRA